MKKLPLGKAGEKIAANYLISQGYEIVEANFFNTAGYRLGEIDLVTKDPQGEWVFVEVKSRKGTRQAFIPGENITPYKIKRILKAIHFYLRQHKLEGVLWRIDLVAILFDFYRRKLDIHHIRSIRE